jgi:hypothetical protein
VEQAIVAAAAGDDVIFNLGEIGGVDGLPLEEARTL